MACTVKVANISSKATLKQIEEFFSFSGHIDSINLTSDEAESQTAYVTFMDKESVKIAVLLSGSVIVDKEVTISPCSNLETEVSAAEHATDSRQSQTSAVGQNRPRALDRAQEMVKTMLARGFSLGKDTIRRAHSLDEKTKVSMDGDALKEIKNGTLHRQKSKDPDDPPVCKEEVSNDKKDEDHVRDETNFNDEGSVMVDNNDGAALQGSEGSRQAIWGSNNVRMGVQKCYKHVCAINERLQLGQRTMSAVATAQQGVANASSAVANNKFVSAGGGWVSTALSRVSLRTPNTSPHLNRESGDDSASHQHEQVQLTEMTTLPARRSEQE